MTPEKVKNPTGKTSLLLGNFYYFRKEETHKFYNNYSEKLI
jgi:hypothetical protein